MYTGAVPAVHGIWEYIKPVIQIDTLFDAVIRADKKCAIVTCGAVYSMSKIFRKQDVAHYIMESDEQANAKALELIEDDKYDLLVVYNGSYDTATHATNRPESEEALAALRENISAFDKLAAATERYWAKYDTLIGFAPDHGNHIDEIEGRRWNHGSDMEEDVNIMHFYGIQPKTV